LEARGVNVDPALLVVGDGNTDHAVPVFSILGPSDGSECGVQTEDREVGILDARILPPDLNKDLLTCRVGKPVEHVLERGVGHSRAA
jgi:hypothetical protein